MWKSLLIMLILCLVFSSVALADDWPAFVAEQFPLERCPVAYWGPLAVLEEMPGRALALTAEAQGVTVKAHWAAFDGMRLLLLYSIEGEAVPAALYAQLTGAWAPGIESPSAAGDGGETFYLVQTLVSKDEEQSVLHVTPMDGEQRLWPIGYMTRDEIFEGPEGNGKVAHSSAEATLTFSRLEIEDGILHAEYALAQQAGGPDAYIAVVVEGLDGKKALNEVQLVDGEGTLEAEIPEGMMARLCVAIDEDASLAHALFGGWQIAIDLNGFDAPQVPVRHVQLEGSRSFGQTDTQDNVAEDATPLEKIAALMAGGPTSEGLQQTSVSLREAFLYQTGATVVYDILPIDANTSFDQETFSDIQSDIMGYLKATWMLGNQPLESSDSGIIYSYGDTGTSAYGYIHLSHPIKPADTLEVTLAHDAFEGGPLVAEIK